MACSISEQNFSECKEQFVGTQDQTKEAFSRTDCTMSSGSIEEKTEDTEQTKVFKNFS